MEGVRINTDEGTRTRDRIVRDQRRSRVILMLWLYLITGAMAYLAYRYL